MSSPCETSSCCQSEAPESTSRTEPAHPGISAYAPLFVIIFGSALAAGARQIPLTTPSGMVWMHDFMGIFLVIFAMVKLFNLQAFARGFANYDLLAARSRAYGFLYPFLELALGLAYLAQWQPTVTYTATIALLTFGALGVLRTMKQGKTFNCACMGEILNVPVSTVTLTENLGMSAMALAMLLL